MLKARHRERTGGAGHPKMVAEANPRTEVEKSLAEWAASIRSEFTRREDFSAAVCNALAARGIAPLAAVVLRVGRWGNAASITRDVEDWYSGLANRLSLQEAQIPQGARRQANQVIEQLWATAQSEVDIRVAQPLRSELAATQEALAVERETSQRQAARIEALQKDLDQQYEQICSLEAALEQAQNSASQAAALAATALEQEQTAHDKTRRDGATALAKAQDDAQRSLEQLQAAAQAQAREAAAAAQSLERQLEASGAMAAVHKAAADTSAQRYDALQRAHEAVRDEVAHTRGLIEGARAQIAHLEAAGREQIEVATVLRESIARLKIQEEKLTNDLANLKLEATRETSRLDFAIRQIPPKSWAAIGITSKDIGGYRASIDRALSRPPSGHSVLAHPPAEERT